MKKHNFLSVGMSFCDIPLFPCPSNVLEMDSAIIHPVVFQTGGDALTVSVVLAKMGENVSLVTNLGNDTNGKFIKKELDKKGVGTQYIRMVEEFTTATSYQLIEENGQRHFLVDNRINVLQKNTDVSEEALEKADLVFFGSALAIQGMDDTEITELFRRSHEKGCITAMDAAYCNPDNEACKMDLLRNALQHTDIFFPSYEEASYLAQKTDLTEIMQEFRRFPFKVFGIKLGADGCIMTEDFENYIRVPAFHTMPVVDTTGAGDCFMGGFLTAYMKGWSLEECAGFGSAVSSFGITAIGPSTAVPDFDTVYRFMQDNK